MKLKSASMAHLGCLRLQGDLYGGLAGLICLTRAHRKAVGKHRINIANQTYQTWHRVQRQSMVKNYVYIRACQLCGYDVSLGGCFHCSKGTL